MFKLVEKNNHRVLHGYFHTREAAEKHLRDVIPMYYVRGFFMDKTLTPESFEIVEVLTK